MVCARICAGRFAEAEGSAAAVGPATPSRHPTRIQQHDPRRSCAAIAGGASGDDLPTCAAGWTVERVATASRILHPTAVACAPDGRVFVCEDNMDMPGPVDRPVNRLLCVHPDGRVTVFADRVYVA